MAYNSRDAEILQALQRGDVLTPAIAHSRWGILALHSCVSRLRKQGHAISCKMVNGHGEYRLTKAVPQESPKIGIHSEKDLAPARASPQVGQEIISFGKRVVVTATGISAYDGTRWTAVREIGPA